MTDVVALGKKESMLMLTAIALQAGGLIIMEDC